MNQAGYFIPPQPHRIAFASHVQWSQRNRLFSAPECDALLALGEKRGWQAASVGDEYARRVDPDYRCVDVAMLDFSGELDWLYERVSGRVEAANRDYYAFDLAGLVEPMQLLRYRAAEKPEETAGHYNWHQDFGAGYMSRRKISVVANLSEPTDYDGCRLTLKTHTDEVMNYLGRGEGCMFPSWTPHYVSPITRGVRYAIVAWVHGPPFR